MESELRVLSLVFSYFKVWFRKMRQTRIKLGCRRHNIIYLVYLNIIQIVFYTVIRLRTHLRNCDFMLKQRDEQIN